MAGRCPLAVDGSRPAERQTQSAPRPTAPGAVNPDVTVKSVHRDDISGQLHIGDDVDPGEVTVRGGRVTIIRGNTFEVELTGGIVSSTTFVQDSQLNAAGNGSIVGSVELEEACVMGIEGELEGQFAGSVRRGVLSANFVLQGREGLAGCHIRLHMRARVSDLRKKPFPGNNLLGDYQEDNQLQRAIVELLDEMGRDPASYPQYARFADIATKDSEDEEEQVRNE